MKRYHPSPGVPMLPPLEQYVDENRCRIRCYFHQQDGERLSAVVGKSFSPDSADVFNNQLLSESVNLSSSHGLLVVNMYFVVADRSIQPTNKITQLYTSIDEFWNQNNIKCQRMIVSFTLTQRNYLLQKNSRVSYNWKVTPHTNLTTWHKIQLCTELKVFGWDLSVRSAPNSNLNLSLVGANFVRVPEGKEWYIVSFNPIDPDAAKINFQDIGDAYAKLVEICRLFQIPRDQILQESYDLVVYDSWTDNLSRSTYVSELQCVTEMQVQFEDCMFIPPELPRRVNSNNSTVSTDSYTSPISVSPIISPPTHLQIRSHSTGASKHRSIFIKRKIEI